MKKNRKLTALLVAACMTIPMAATTFTVPMVASGAEYIIQIDVGTYSGQAINTVNYYAFQVFEGSGNETSFGVSGWGSNINVQELINDVNKELSNAFDGVSDDANGAIKASEKLAGFDQNQKLAFARLVGKNIVLGNGDNKEAKLQNSASAWSSQITDGKVSLNVEKPGYYVIIESYAPTYSNEQVKTSRTLGLLKVVSEGTNSIEPKRSYPTVTKTVKDSDQDDFAPAADAYIGENVTFKISCTLPDHLEYYENYYFEINDKLGKGLTYNDDLEINGLTNATENKDYKVTVTDDGENKSIIIQFEDIKRLGCTSSGTIDVTYTATLNAQADTGNQAFTDATPDPQENSVKLTYLSNPNVNYSVDDTNEEIETPPLSDNTGETNTESTPISIAKVYTYNLKIDKFEKDNDNKKLSGAKFKLKKNNQYAILTDNLDGTYTFSGWNNNGTEIITTANGATIIGIDADTYALTELEAPEGYNKLTSDVDVVINAEFNNTELSKLSLNSENSNGDLNTGTVELDVPNAAGATLPETGGIGTKIFYVLGGTLVIGSGAALVIKKRMGKDEE